MFRIASLVVSILLVMSAFTFLYLGVVDEYIRPAITYYSPLLDEPIGSPGKAVTHLTTKKSYRPGEIVEARVNYIKDRDLVASVQWSLTNEFTLTFPPRPGGLPAIGHGVKVIPVERIPPNAMPGPHYFIGLATYNINFMCTKSYPIRTNEFMIVAK